MPRLSRCRVVLLLFLILLPAAVQAAEPRRDTELVRSESSALIARDVLVWVWSVLTSTQGDNGCEVDPSGRCRLGQMADNGCEADPNGRCLH